MANPVSRRAFAASLSLPALMRQGGANSRIGVAFIGVGNRGRQLLEAVLPNADVQVVALCDVYEPYLRREAERFGGRVRLEKDYRRVLEMKEVDAVFIATPDHWHALQTVDACDAGKDVYVEKPLSMTVVEGRRMVEAARRNARVVQVGLQRRSSAMYRRIRQLVQSDAAGKITVARAYRITNMWPMGIGKAPNGPPPPDLDWDLWLGPRPARPFNPNIAPYKFRWWQQYSSQVANWGVHYFDILRYVLGEAAPSSLSAHGGKYAIDDDRDIPDTMEVTFEFASGRLMLFGQYEASGMPMWERAEVELRGTKGCILAGSRGFELVPETPGQFQEKGERAATVRDTTPDGNLDRLHVRDFLDCVASRAAPACDVEEGHRSTTFAHLANIALATRSRLVWDAKAERVVGNPRANGLLHYRYRSPWRLR